MADQARESEGLWKLVPVEPTAEMIDRFVSRALCVSVHGDGGWSQYAAEQWAAMLAAVPDHSVAPVTDTKQVEKKCTPSSNSDAYGRTFYGILNAQGAFWTPLAFPSREAASSHIENFWRHDPVVREQCLRTHRIVPVRIRLDIAAKGEGEMRDG